MKEIPGLLPRISASFNRDIILNPAASPAYPPCKMMMMMRMMMMRMMMRDNQRRERDGNNEGKVASVIQV